VGLYQPSMKEKTAILALVWVESVAVEEFAFKRREEALAQGVIVCVPHGPHRWTDACLPTPPTEGERAPSGRASSASSVRRSRAMDQPMILLDQASMTKAGKEEPGVGGDVRDVADPQLVRAGGREVTPH